MSIKKNARKGVPYGLPRAARELTMPRIRQKTKSPAARSAETREWLGLSREQYRKRYDVFKLQIRAYERATGAIQGEMSPAYILHDIAYRMRYEGGRLTAQEQAILQTPAYSRTAKISQYAQLKAETATILMPFRALANSSRTPQSVIDAYYGNGVFKDMSIAERRGYIERYAERKRRRAQTLRAQVRDREDTLRRLGIDPAEYAFQEEEYQTVSEADYIYED